MSAECFLAAAEFEAPGLLALLGLLPPLVLLSLRSLASLGPIRRWLALALRCLVIACLAAALAGARWVRHSDALSVIVLVDRSRSIPHAQQLEAFEFLRAAADSLRPTKDRLGVVAFDGRAAVEQLPMAALAIDHISAPLAPDQTNLAAALRIGLALFTDETARRLVVLSDGNENTGTALEEIEQIAAAGVPVDVVPLRYHHHNEVLVERLSAPPTAQAEETVRLQVMLRSQSPEPVSGRLVLYHNEHLVDLDPLTPGAGQPVRLNPGPNRHEIAVPLRAAGAHRFRVVFEPDEATGDTIAANNEGRAFTVVSGQGRILILAGQGLGSAGGDWRSAQLLAEALQRERLVCDVAVAGQEPLDQVRLLEYSAVILSNVSADRLTPEERQGLAVYVRDLGGGLIMIGGDESFGAGGWMDTPIEEVMPVSFDVKSRRQIPKGALALILHACEIPQGNYWAERVAIAAVKTLSSRDLVGVASYRWRDAKERYWDYPLQPVGDKTRVIQAIKRMEMGDLPDLDGPLRSAVDALAGRPDAAVKHVIVTSDFDCAMPRSDVLQKMRQYNITCSTVAIGFGMHVDVRRAQWLAKQTNGRYYGTRDYSKLPQIFIKESRIVRRSLINETPFVPQLVSTLPTTVAGLAGEPLPQLGGYVVTTAKPLAAVPLVRPTGQNQADPVLAHWQVGLGKTVAFTSGMWTRWGADWAAWPKFGKLWAQIVRWASRPSPGAAFDVSTTVQGGRGKIRLDALDKNAAAINFMTVGGTLVRPDQQTEPLRLVQTGPGVYEAEFDAQAAGSYVASLSYRLGRGKQAVAGTLHTGVSVAFSPEYRELEANETLLNEMAARTGGRLLDRNQAQTVFDPARLPPAAIRRPVWEYLLRWLLVLFLLDVAVRRVALDPLAAARKLRVLLAELAGKRPSEASEAVLATLKGTRRRVQEELEPTEAAPTPDRAARYQATAPEAKPADELERALSGTAEADKPVVARPTRKPPPTDEADFAARLLRAKKRARERLEQEDRERHD